MLGRNITARIANLRAVEWQSLGINFVLVFSPGAAMRNYLLLSSPAPFRSRNLFIDEDSLIVV